jgi:class 3 adenylate cyclase
MPELPTGTVTFLFTDIEGSTKAVQRLGTESYNEILGRHARLIRAVLAGVGHEVSTEGDSFFAVFENPKHAVRAAVQAQRSLAGETWPDEAPIRVRMGSGSLCAKRRVSPLRLATSSARAGELARC